MNTEKWDFITTHKIIAVVIIDDAANAVPLCRVLLDHGIRAVEVALRTPGSVQSLDAIKQEVPDMVLGAGTVLDLETVHTVSSIGVDFAVAPGLNTRVVQTARQLGVPFAPGVATPSEIECACQSGCATLKLFPAEPLGGIPYFKTATTPYNHLKLRYIPLGGLNLENFTAYLTQPNIPAIGGSWIAPRSLIAEKNWKQIGQNARLATEKLEQLQQ